MPKHVYPLYSGLNVVEVAHDIQLSVSKFVTQELKVLNSFDTWHGNMCKLSRTCILYCSKFRSGTKNEAKELAKITQGRVRDRGVTWFPELVDKRK